MTHVEDRSQVIRVNGPVRGHCDGTKTGALTQAVTATYEHSAAARLVCATRACPTCEAPEARP